jgi:hypothetical protein
MGCDGHFYVEYSDKEKRSDGKKYWHNFGGRFNPGRNYGLFGFLTNGKVRYDCSPKHGIDPRGLPEGDLSWYAEHDSRLYITEDGKAEGEISLETALNWQKNYRCKIYNDREGNPFQVDSPDYHTKTWMTCKEFGKLLNEASRTKRDYIGVGSEYKALLAAMKSLEKSGKEVRIIFWFDN